MTPGGRLEPGPRRRRDRGAAAWRWRRSWIAVAVAAAIVVGAAAEAQRGPGWEVRVPDRIELAPGVSGTLAIGIAVDRGLAVSKDATVIVDLAADPGLTLKRRRLGRAEAVDPEADAPRFSAAVRADAPGDHTVKVRIRFWLCGASACRPIDVRRTVAIAVTAPQPTLDAGAVAGDGSVARPGSR